MKKVLIALSLICSIAQAQEVRYANIVSVTPVTDNVRVVKQQCGGSAGYRDEPSIAGKVVGGIVGFIGGSMIGQGKGNTAAKIVGTAAGVAVGDAYDEQNRYQANCRGVTTYEPVRGGYMVVYELDGVQYTTRSQTVPRGSTIPVKMGPVPYEN